MRIVYAAVCLAGAFAATQVAAQSATESAPRRTERAVGQAGAANQAINRTGQPQAGQAGATQPGAQAGKLEKHITACLLLGNREEIALGEFAQSRAQNEQVKQFAQQMVEQHQQMVDKLEQVAPDLASKTQLSGQAGGGRANPASAPADNQRAGGDEHDQMLALGRKIKENCLKLTQQQLGEKQGADFDKAYIGQQLVAHTSMLAELQATQEYATGKLRPILDEGVQNTEQHLAMAKQIMEQLKGDEPRQAARPGTPRAEATPPARRN
jgi:predicted outer membrane protein